MRCGLNSKGISVLFTDCKPPRVQELESCNTCIHA